MVAVQSPAHTARGPAPGRGSGPTRCVRLRRTQVWGRSGRLWDSVSTFGLARRRPSPGAVADGRRDTQLS